MAKYEFEAFQEKHLQDLLEIYNFYILCSTATFHKKILTLEEMRELLAVKDSKYETCVIKEGNQIYGYVLLCQYKTREAYDATAEVTIYLKDNCIGKGAGSEALKYIEAIAIDKGFHTLIATICGENENSIRLFEKNGYEKCAHYKEVGRKFERWLDIWVFQKLLPS